MMIDVPPACLVTPPIEFIREPTAIYEIVELTNDQIRNLGDLVGVPPVYTVCGLTIPYGDTGRYFIYVNTDLPVWAVEIVLIHEKAHVNGWDHG